MIGRYRLFGGVALPALASGFMLASMAAVAPVHAAACTGAVNTPNSTTCTGGSTGTVLTYLGSNGQYDDGDFTLTLDNHDVTAGGIIFGLGTGDIDGGDILIILKNDSDVANPDASNGFGAGIIAHANSSGEDILIDVLDTSSVTGGIDGILATTEDGAITVTTEVGTDIRGGTGAGIRAVAQGDTTVTAGGIVAGGHAGIDAHSIEGSVKVSTGVNALIVSGTVTAAIAAITETGAVEVNAGGTVIGGNDGILAFSQSGAIKVTTLAGSAVTGIFSDGIEAQNVTGGNVEVGTGSGSSVRGGLSGILADGHGDGTVKVVTGANATVTGDTDAGIAAQGETGTVAVTTGATSKVTGAVNGISAVSSSGQVTVEAGVNSSADGGLNGISARSLSGQVTVKTESGSVIKGNGSNGIVAIAEVSGSVAVTNGGATRGFFTGIAASSSVTDTVQITNTSTGVIENLSGDNADRAIVTAGGAATIDNNNGGLIRGLIVTGNSGDVLNNDGVWATDGGSDFGGGNDTVNNRSAIFVGIDAGEADITTFAGLETLNNSGSIILTDQVAGDGSNFADRLEIAGNYVGSGGAVLGLDASLGDAGSVADILVVGGDTSGVTGIVINNTSLEEGALNTAGILVVVVQGIAQAGDFVLANGPIDTGFFIYDLVFFNDTDQANDQFRLVSTADNGLFEPEAAVANSQAIWQETAGVWEMRQQTVRDRVNAGVLVTAVADPVLPGSVAPENGLWFSALGSWTARNSEISGLDLSYDQSIYGFAAGADFGVDLGNDSTLLFGVLAGYIDSTLKFDASSTAIKTDGATLGVYASLLQGGFFANVLVQADLLNQNFSAPSLPGDTSDDADVTSIGARADLGYRFDNGDLFVEPMLSLDAVSTSIDEFSVGGADIDPGTNESFRAGAGLRAGLAGERATASLTGRVWNVFAADNEVVFTTGDTVLDLSDDSLEGLYGEVSGQVDIDLSETAVLFVKGGVLFSDDITKPSVSGGFNFTW